ncbi:serine/threonine-protein kinase [Streptomyces sp. NPDC055103]
MLGAGGFGRVWAARDELLQANVAIKELLLDPHLPDAVRRDRLQRAEREARNAVKLRDHPHVISVHDVVVIDEAPWIVMQLVSGDTLQERLSQRERLSVDDTARLARALLDALDAAHGMEIVHRDIKPANIMLTDDDRILLADFGIAVNRADSRLTATGFIVGSLPYLSPERAQGEEAGPASDLFSLGATLYEAVEGVSPFLRADPAGSLHAVAYEEAPPMRHAGRLSPLITALLAKGPHDRPSIREALRLFDTPSSSEATTTGTSSTAALTIENRTGTWISVLLDDTYHDVIRPRTTGTFTLGAGDRKVAVKCNGRTSAPKVFHLKAGVTERGMAWLHGENVLVGHLGRPTAQPPVPADEPGAGCYVGLVAVALFFLCVLYSEHNGFANWASSVLNHDVSNAQVGDCVHYTGEGKWVSAACWSAATRYEVEYRIAASEVWSREKYASDGCDAFYAFKADPGSVSEGLYETVAIQGPDATRWELCVKARGPAPS